MDVAVASDLSETYRDSANRNTAIVNVGGWTATSREAGTPARAPRMAGEDREEDTGRVIAARADGVVPSGLGPVRLIARRRARDDRE